MTSGKTFSFEVPEAFEGRLDAFLIAALSGVLEKDDVPTRSQILRLVEEGLVTVGDKPAKKGGVLVSAGDSITVRLDRRKPLALQPAAIPLRILYEDAELVVIDKPRGMSMHPGAGRDDGTLVHALLAHVGEGIRGVGADDRPGIVHRLDKDTTGVVVVAKTVSAHSKLAKQFEARTIDRHYSALVLMMPRGGSAIRSQDAGSIDAPISRHPVDRKKMAIVEGGRRAVTHWTILERMPWSALLDLKLETGRTHQIRVHMEHAKCPVIGDAVYGNFSALPKPLQAAAATFGRQALHARSLAFLHPKTNERLSFESPVPDDFQALIETFCGWEQP